MIKAFGIEQAKLASKFAKTVEQKKTVLATMAMLGIKNTLAKKIAKGRTKALNKIMVTTKKIKTIRAKLDKVAVKETEQVDRIEELNTVSLEWNNLE